MINIEIKDHHNSKTIGLIPEQLHEPIALIAKVKRFDSIDDYVIDVVKRELESIRKGGHAADDFGESIAKYVQNMSPPLGSFSSDDDNSDDEDKDKDEDRLYEEIPVTLKLNKNIAEVVRIFARNYHGADSLGYFDKFINEQIIKIIKSLATTELTAGGSLQDKFPDSLKQHIQKLLSSSSSKEEEEEREKI